MSGFVALLPWLDAAALPGGLPAGVTVSHYASELLPPPGELADVELYVLPYLGPARDVELIRRLPRLKVLQTLTAGVDHVLGRLSAGVTLCNAAGVHDASTAELAIGLILARLRGIDAAARDAVGGTWDHQRRPSLADSRVLVVGFGGVGRAIAARLAGFEVTVVPVARSARPGVAGLGELPDLLPTADVVVLAVPLTSETSGLVDARFLARLKDGALLVNVARGPVVVTDDLLAELRGGRIQAALDVTDPEPLPPDHPLWSAPGVLVTPHVGGDTTAFVPRGRALVADQLRRYAGGAPLINVIA